MQSPLDTVYINKYEMGGACSIHGKDEKFVRNVWTKENKISSSKWEAKIKM
jgi:hypothetical protein